MVIESRNPATGSLIRAYEAMPPAKTDAIIAAVHHGYESWRRTTFAERGGPMRRLAALLRERPAEYARLMAEEMGKPVKQGVAEIVKCAGCCEHFADHAGEYLAPELIPTDAAKSYVACRPLGVILAVMPWNFPFWQVFRCAVPALMAGNAVVMKPASNVPGCALAIEAAFRAAGFPPDLFRTLLVGAAAVDRIIADPRIAAVTLTGSTPAGRAVAAQAGAALKKTVLELGGSDPYVVLEDADLPRAATSCVTARLVNTGQTCIAAKRFIVVEEVRREFESLVLDRMNAATMGDPLREDVDLGPMARPDLRDELHQQVLRSVAQGARLLLGGTVPDGPGAWYPPTILTGVRKGMPAYDEELFGPVAAICPAPDEAAAVRIANDTVFGLGAAVFTEDLERGERIAAEEFEAGCCFVNDFVRSDPRLPFGGIKESGYGRELAAPGIREFVNLKTVYIR